MSPALTCIQAFWDAMPYGNSRERYRHGMFTALRNAVVSGMRFAPDDFSKMKNPGSWCGDQGGEVLYALACGSDRLSDNTSAAIAMEKWFGRPAAIWAEKTKTPQRLYVGADFTWDGRVVKITSMDNERLVACTYTDERDSRNCQVGDLDYFAGDYREILQRKDAENGSIFVQFGAAEKGRERRKVDKRYSIKFAEMAAARKAYDTRRKGYEKQIAEATTLSDLDAVATAATAEGRHAFRHFDIEMLREAIKVARARIKESMTEAEHAAERERMELSRGDDLKRWMAGEKVNRHFDVVRLRVKDGYVETSTGQHATVESARKAVIFIRLMRKKPAGWKSSGDPDSPKVDLFDIVSISREGVQVGCTFVPMEEIDRITPMLKTA